MEGYEAYKSGIPFYNIALPLFGIPLKLANLSVVVFIIIYNGWLFSFHVLTLKKHIMAKIIRRGIQTRQSVRQ